jgi:hypothetical protein
MHSFIVLVANSVFGSPRPTGHAEMICNRSFMMRACARLHDRREARADYANGYGQSIT